jgi:hypothetical protein
MIYRPTINSSRDGFRRNHRLFLDKHKGRDPLIGAAAAAAFSEAHDRRRIDLRPRLEGPGIKMLTGEGAASRTYSLPGLS